MKNIHKLLILSAVLVGSTLTTASAQVVTLPGSPIFVGSSGGVSANKYPELCNAFVGVAPFGYGESGEHIKRLQVVLGQEGIAFIAATGYFGPVTRSAVKVFQARNGISQTGAVGPITMARMKALWCAGSNTLNSNPPTNTDYNSNGVVEVSIAPISSSNAGVLVGWNSKNANSCTLNNQSVAPSGQQNFYITGETNYTISCNGVSKTIVVRPNQSISNLPNVNVYINPTSALVNTYATIYWTSTNAYFCNLNGQTIPTSGSQQVYVSSVSTSYVITCINQTGQSVSTTINSNVGNVPPTNTNNGISFTATPNSVSSGQPVTLYWSAPNYSSCYVSGGTISGNYQSNSGSQVIYPTVSGTYTLNCYFASNSAPSTATVYVSVNGGTTNGNATFTAYPTSVNSGQPVTLSWSAPNSSYCNITGGNTVLSNQNANGSATVYPTTSTTYQLACYNSYNQATSNSSTYVTVGGTSGNGPVFTVSPSTTNVSSGQPAYLTLSGTYLSSCTVNGGTYTNYNLPLIQTLQYPNYTSSASLTVYPTVSTTYTFTCYGTNGGSSVQTAYVTVNGGSSGNLTVNISAVPLNNGSYTLNLSASSVSPITYCSINGGQYSNSNFPFLPSTGGQSYGSLVVYPNPGTVYTVTCYNTTGQSGYGTVTPGTSGGSFSATLTANPTSANSGQAVTLTWYSSGTSYCSLLANGQSLINNQGISGTYVTYPAISTNYQINCINSANQTVSNYAYVTVSGNGSNSSVLISPTTNLVIGSVPTVTWNYSNGNAQGVLLSLYDSNNVYIGHLTRNTSNPNSGSFSWTIPTVIFGYGGDVMTCITVNGQQQCGIDPKQITTGTYKIRATYFTPANACFGFCQVVPGQQTLGTVDSASFTITSSGTTNGNASVTVTPASSTIALGQTSTFTFSVANASYCNFNGGVYNNSYFSGNSLNGPITVSPATSTTYTATCYGSNGSSQIATSTVNVSSNTTYQITLSSRVNGYVVISVANFCSVNGFIDWGDGSTKVTLTQGVCGSGGTFAHQYTASTGQSFLVKVTNQSNSTLSSLSVVPFP